MTTALVVGLVAAVTVASFAQALTGFGFALVAIPLLTVLTGPQAAIVSVTVLAGALTLAAGVHQRAAVQWSTVGTVAVASFLGMPIGLLVLNLVSARVLSVLIGVLVLVFALLAGRRVVLRRGPRTVGAAGALSGAMLTSTGINGPPLVAAFHAMRLPPRPFRATLQATFCIQAAVALVGFAVVGQVTDHALLVAAVGLPGMLLGWLLGEKLFARADPERFTIVVRGLLAVSGCVTLLQAALG